VPGRRIRVGIDVGGTFTDAVAVDSQTLQLVGQAKVPTTHQHREGVARGIVDALEQLLRTVDATPDDVSFLAHGTTQATNALLEGDVAAVGVIGLGSGLEGRRVARLVRIGRIELAPGRDLPVHSAYLPESDVAALPGRIEQLRRDGAEVVVAAAAFSVDDPAAERTVMEAARAQGLSATGTHEITKLYGLRRRTRTAVVNACILPRMLSTADLVQKSIKDSGLSAPLMVMRCDGGVMSLDEMRRRPLLTILSGPAAGVAGALMSEQVADGIFLETGGTSTDISVIKTGRVATRYAEIGGHETFLSSLDVRTVGIGGGSMPRVEGGRIVAVGPRSAHIAGLAYSCYAEPAQLDGAQLVAVAPLPGDRPDHVVVDAAGGRFALTVTCAANLLGLVPPDNYAFAPPEAARRAFAPLAAALGGSVEDAARSLLDTATQVVRRTVKSLIDTYALDRTLLRLVGGGGGAATVLPFLADAMTLPFAIAAHAEVISPLGVALALVRETVERIIPDASQSDILSVRTEAERTVLDQGADPRSVEVDVEVDARRNLVRAVATGATDLRAGGRGTAAADEGRARAAAVQGVGGDPGALTLAASTPDFRVFTGAIHRTGLRALFGPRTSTSVVDRDATVRYRTGPAAITRTAAGSARTVLESLVAEYTDYSGGAPRIPTMRLLVGGRIVNLTGMTRVDQVVAVAESDLTNRPDDEPVVILAEVNR
jgi:N-methylhydantoinase A/oxoprolinase/acetone carboxylase beta subunit